MLRNSALLLFSVLAVPTANANAPPAGIDDIIKKLEARFEPAEAHPGDSVTLKVELKLADGWHTYPTIQKDAGARIFVNKLTLPKDGAVRFAAKVKEPPNPTIREEPLLDIKEMHTYPGGGTWECEAKISPDAKPGSKTVRIRIVVLVVDPTGGGHFAPKSFDLDATIKILKPLPE